LFRRKPRPPATLRELVETLAARPTAAKREAFQRALLAAEVAVPLRGLPDGVGLGPGVAAAGQFAVPQARGPDGALMLLVYTDEAAALEAPQATAGFALAGRVVLEMAASNNLGVLVSAGGQATSAWAAVPREQVAAVLAQGQP
jgi:hypothetical protein